MPTLADMAGVSGTAKVNNRGQQLKQDALAQMAAQEEAQRRAAEWLMSQPDAVKAFLASLQQRVRGASLAELAENPAYVAQAQAGGGQAPMLRNLAADVVGAAGEFAPSRLDVATAGLGKLAALGGKMGMVAGPIVYHGTPHTFAPTEANVLGEFDASKIGTGEGAQAYGHGIYLAENPSVAKGYQSTLSEKIGVPGSLYKVNLPDEMAGQMMDWELPFDQQPKSVQNKLMNVVSQAASVKTMGRQQLIDALQKMDPNGVYSDADSMAEFGRALSTKELKAIAKELELEKYLAESTSDILSRNPTGQSLYVQLATQASGDLASGQQYVSRLLRESGIPGVTYLDEGSRKVGAGTRDYVVFPGAEKRVKILKREQ